MLQSEYSQILCVSLNILLDYVTRNTIYECLLHAAATRKDELKQAFWDWKRHQTTAEIIFDTKPKDKNLQRKLNEELFECLGKANNIIPPSYNFSGGVL